jgi:hypothetical protein
VTDTPASASEGLAQLTERRNDAQGRVDQLEVAQRAATVAREQASAALVEAERTNAASAQRAKLERALTDAEAHSNERWGERITGAQARVRDIDGEIRRYTTEHLAELIEEVEAEGRAVVERINQLAAELLGACQARSGIESRLFSVLAATGRTNRAGDVNRGRSGDLAAAAADFVRAGGEVAPEVRVDVGRQSAAA